MGTTSHRSLLVGAVLVVATCVAFAEPSGVAWLVPGTSVGVSGGLAVAGASVGGGAFVDAAEGSEGSGARVMLGVSVSDMGEFGTDWGLRGLWGRGNWLVSGGWNRVDDTVPSLGEAMRVKGDLWQADVSYVWWNDDRAPRGRHWGGEWYFGMGPGVRNIDARWTVAGISEDAKKLEYTGHVCAGAQFRRCFFDVRYVVGPNLFGYDADGGQVTFGILW